MKKLTNINYKGIDYIQLSALSSVQAESLKQTLTKRTLIKILKNDIILDDCVLYNAYEKWFDSINEEVKQSIIKQPETEFTKPVPVA